MGGSNLKALFRHATRMEKALNVVGLLACMVAGAAQPIMNLPFGKVSTTLRMFTDSRSLPTS
jgi:hypothetical protein